MANRPEIGIGNVVDHEDIGNIIWNRRADMETIFEKIQSKCKDLEQFCGENKNVHKKIKDWASKLITLTGSLAEELEGLRGEALRNEEELKRRQAIAVGHAEMSLRAMENSMLAPAACSSPNCNREERPVKPAKVRLAQVVDEKDKKKAKMKSKKKKRAPRLTWNGTQGVVIQSDGTSYAEVAKRIKEDVDLESIGVKITSVQQASSGGIILNVGKGAEAAVAAARLQAAVEGVVGNSASVKSSAKPALIEVLGVGCTEETEDVISSLIKEGLTKEEIHMRYFIPSFKGMKRVVVAIPGAAAQNILKKGRLTVGLVECRVRVREQKVRCFRCHGFDHRAAGCKMTDRSKMCMTCGEEGHVS